MGCRSGSQPNPSILRPRLTLPESAQLTLVTDGLEWLKPALAVGSCWDSSEPQHAVNAARRVHRRRSSDVRAGG